jgi:hypothetical protein
MKYQWFEVSNLGFYWVFRLQMQPPNECEVFLSWSLKWVGPVEVPTSELWPRAYFLRELAEAEVRAFMPAIALVGVEFADLAP